MALVLWKQHPTYLGMKQLQSQWWFSHSIVICNKTSELQSRIQYPIKIIQHMLSYFFVCAGKKDGTRCVILGLPGVAKMVQNFIV